MSRSKIAALAMIGFICIALITYSILGWWSSRDWARLFATQQQLSAFSSNSCLYGWLVKHDREEIPGPGLSDAIRAMREDQFYMERILRDCPLLLEGRDAWGRPFIYEVRSDGKRAVVRSMGRNGKNDYGFADDIQSEVRLFW